MFDLPPARRLLERQFVSYLMRLHPDFDFMLEDRKREIAWAFYAGVTALNRALREIEPGPAFADLLVEIDSITERMHAEALTPTLTDTTAFRA